MQLKLKSKSKKFSKEKEDSIIKDYLKGLNTVEIANKWDTYNTSIRRVLIRNNITLRSNKIVQSRIKVNPFKDNNETSNYLIGLFLTDGSISIRGNSKTISISLKDKEMIEKIRNFICPKNKVYKYTDKRFLTDIYKFLIRNNSIAEWLQTKGNFYNKSYNCDIYTSLNNHILRGIFDGDGYWHLTNNKHTIVWGICGRSLIFLEKILKYLQGLNIKSYISKKKKPLNKFLYHLEVYKTVDVIKIANLMYKEAHIYLQRKYDKWHLFEETLKEKFSKFKEGDAYSNPEPSYNKSNHLINRINGRYIIEGAETIMRYLNIN